MKLKTLILSCFAMSATGAFAVDLFTLSGKAYSEKDLPSSQQQQFFEVEMQRYEQLRMTVDQVVLDMHLEEESKKQGKAKAEIEKKLFDVKEPSEKAVKSWYEENKSKIPPNYQFDQIKGEIVKIVKQEEIKKKRDSVLDKIKKEKKFTLLTPRPESPVIDVKIDGFPSKGKDGAKVTIVEFADYQCPHCKAAVEPMKKLADKFKDKVKLVFVDYPINPSGVSKTVAEGSHCAAEQGKYWEYHYKAFESQNTLDKDSPAKLAKELKLDEGKFKTCFDGTKGKAVVEKGKAEGERIGVSGTPFILINGKRYMGAHNYESFVKEVETALK